MANKARYIEILTQVLNEHYKEVKRHCEGSKDRQQYVDGYLAAARVLDAFSYD